ncbi:hypothetical protein [Azotosporobacter soli]|uniref:hypothetical protein n=1 Tax=Azotosporobacter soli TaxID=3055040 RepID=UPI0031FEDE03
MNTIIYFALLFAMLSLGRFIGEKLFSALFNWAVRSQNSTLLRSFVSAPNLAFWERGLFTVLVMAVLFSMPISSEIENLAVFLACGLSMSLVETGFSLLKGYWAVKDAGDGLTEAEKRHYTTQRVIEEGVQAIQDKDKEKQDE